MDNEQISITKSEAATSGQAIFIILLLIIISSLLAFRISEDKIKEKCQGNALSEGFSDRIVSIRVNVFECEYLTRHLSGGNPDGQLSWVKRNGLITAKDESAASQYKYNTERNNMDIQEMRQQGIEIGPRGEIRE